VKVSKIILSLVSFKLTWICLVVFRYEGILPALLLVLATVYFLPYTLRQLMACVLVAGMGIVIDTLLIVTGVFQFGSDFIPGWLVLLWFSFSLALHFGFSLLADFRFYLQVLLGSVAGIVSYFSGMAIGSIKFVYSLPITAVVLMLVWALFFPVLLHISKRSRNEKIIHQ
jgi:hypothetical protein